MATAFYATLFVPFNDISLGRNPSSRFNIRNIIITDGRHISYFTDYSFCLSHFVLQLLFFPLHPQGGIFFRFAEISPFSSVRPLGESMQCLASLRGHFAFKYVLSSPKKKTFAASEMDIHSEWVRVWDCECVCFDRPISWATRYTVCTYLWNGHLHSASIQSSLAI